MAAHALAQAYNNLTLKDLLKRPSNISGEQQLQREVSPNIWNECRFAVPPVTDVSCIFQIVIFRLVMF